MSLQRVTKAFTITLETLPFAEGATGAALAELDDALGASAADGFDAPGNTPNSSGILEVMLLSTVISGVSRIDRECDDSKLSVEHVDEAEDGRLPGDPSVTALLVLSTSSSVRSLVIPITCNTLHTTDMSNPRPAMPPLPFILMANSLQQAENMYRIFFSDMGTPWLSTPTPSLRSQSTSPKRSSVSNTVFIRKIPAELLIVDSENLTAM